MRIQTINNISLRGQKKALAPAILAVLPAALFFPQAIFFLGIVLFLIVLLCGGGLRSRVDAARSSPLFWPAMTLLAISLAAGLLLPRPAGEFWPGFLHYQNYLFLLLFLTVGAGAWQNRAIAVFYWAATVAATLLYLNAAVGLPALSGLSSYAKYSGNKSIQIAILIAIAAAWMLVDLVTAKRLSWWRVLHFGYLALAAITVARSRTALAVFGLSVMFVLLAVAGSWRRRLGLIGAVTAAAVLALQFLPVAGNRLAGTMADIAGFARGMKVSAQGERLEMYRLTMDLIREAPLVGHGIGSWIGNYAGRAAGTLAPLHSTPHNDYLLYLAEIGVIGLAALLWLFWTQLRTARRLDNAMGARLAILTLSLAVAAMFNAILRDAVFALSFMVLLAIPLAGVSRQSLSEMESERA